MGYNLNRLMRQYGLATPTMAQYTGEMGPDVETIDEETGEVTTTPGTVTFDPAKQAAFDDYQAQYQFRLGNRPMYESSQFRTTPTQQQPQTYEDMFTMYLGRQPGDGERTTITEVGSGPISDAQRQQFLRQYENEFADLGIRNTGNQLVSDQIGNYYGNILRNPDFNSNNNLPTPTNPVDPSAPFIERNPTAVNPNPPYAGPVITTDQGYENAVIDGVVQPSWFEFAEQQNQNFSNINNPVPITGYTLEEAYRIDPFAPASNSLASGFTYLNENPDVMAHVNAQADAAGLAPSPERYEFMTNAAKDHFLYQLGQGEGRSWYKKGGSVKGYRHGGGTMPHSADAGMAGIEDPQAYYNPAGIRVDITTPKAKLPTLDQISETIVTGESPTNESLILEMLEKGEMAPTAYEISATTTTTWRKHSSISKNDVRYCRRSICRTKRIRAMVQTCCSIE